MLSLAVLLAEASRGADEPPAAAAPSADSPPANGLPTEAPAAAEKLDIEDIMFQPPATPTSTGSVLTPSATDTATSNSVGELLEEAPGVSSRRTSGINLDTRVRGFHSGQLNANANGMTQLKTRIDIDSLFSQIDPDIVRSIAVVQGPYTSLHGPGFAFLNAELFPAERYPDGPELHGTSLLAHKSNGRQIHDRQRLWGGGVDWSLQFSYGLRTGNDYRAGGESDDFRIPSSYHAQDLFTAMSVDLSYDTRVEFNFIHQDLADVELPGVAYDINDSHTDQFNIRYVVQADRAGPENLVLQFWSHRTPFDVDSLHTSKQRTFERVLAAQPFADYYPAIASGNLFIKLLGEGLSKSSGVRSLVTFGEAEAAQLTIGVDYRRHGQFYREADFDGEGTPAFGGNIYGIPESVQEDFGLLTHLLTPVSDTINFTLGGRVDRVNSSINRDDLVVRVIDPSGEGIFRPGVAEPEQVLGMGYATVEVRPENWLTLTGGVAYAMRSPNLAELYSDEPYVPVVRFGNSYTDGNSDLDPERLIQFDLGATAKWERFSAGARGFYSSIHDYILGVPSNFSTPVPAGIDAPRRLRRNFTAFGIDTLDPAIVPDADSTSLDYRYSNISRASLYGTELVADCGLRPGMSLHATLSYVRGTNHARVRFDDTTGSLVPLHGDEPLPGIYPLNSTISLHLFEPEEHRWSLEFVARFVDDQSLVAESLAEIGTPGFAVFDLHASYRLSENVRLMSSLINLFDRTYFEHGSLAIVDRRGNVGFVKEPGFTWMTGVEVRF